MAERSEASIGCPSRLTVQQVAERNVFGKVDGSAAMSPRERRWDTLVSGRKTATGVWVESDGVLCLRLNAEAPDWVKVGGSVEIFRPDEADHVSAVRAPSEGWSIGQVKDHNHCDLCHASIDNAPERGKVDECRLHEDGYVWCERCFQRWVVPGDIGFVWDEQKIWE